MKYDWRNVKTGEVVEHTSYNEPPKLKGKWERIYTFEVGHIAGGTGSGLKKVKKGKRATIG